MTEISGRQENGQRTSENCQAQQRVNTTMADTVITVCFRQGNGAGKGQRSGSKEAFTQAHSHDTASMRSMHESNQDWS